jgi:ubiquinone/menaquinone biosynthesis C-methylase UbiE
MMDEHFAHVAEAFSRKATKYDEFGRDHENLTRMRGKVYAALESAFRPGSALLELNAGTGADAVAMVGRGFRVHATDLSGGMVAAIEEKISAFGLEEKLSAQQCSFTDLADVSGGPYSGVYSNFGGLNCTTELEAVARGLPRLLLPGSAVVLVVMPPICPWELAHLPMDPKTATRRLRGGGVQADVEGVRFLTHYYSPRQIMAAFGDKFRRESLEAISLVTPTADNKAFAKRLPRFYRSLVWLDDRLSTIPPFWAWGDFYCLTLRYAGVSGRHGS